MGDDVIVKGMTEFELGAESVPCLNMKVKKMRKMKMLLLPASWYVERASSSLDEKHPMIVTSSALLSAARTCLTVMISTEGGLACSII